MQRRRCRTRQRRYRRLVMLTSVPPDRSAGPAQRQTTIVPGGPVLALGGRFRPSLASICVSTASTAGDLRTVTARDHELTVLPGRGSRCTSGQRSGGDPGAAGTMMLGRPPGERGRFHLFERGVHFIGTARVVPPHGSGYRGTGREADAAAPGITWTPSRLGRATIRRPSQPAGPPRLHLVHVGAVLRLGHERWR